MDFNAVTIESLLGARDVALTTDKRAYSVTLATGERVTLASDDEVRTLAGLVSAHADKQAKARAEQLLSPVPGTRDTGPARAPGTPGNRYRDGLTGRNGVTGTGAIVHSHVRGSGQAVPSRANGKRKRNPVVRAPGGMSGDVTIRDAAGKVLHTIDGPATRAERRQAARTRRESAGNAAPVGTPNEIAREDRERAQRMARAATRAR